MLTVVTNWVTTVISIVFGHTEVFIGHFETFVGDEVTVSIPAYW